MARPGDALQQQMAAGEERDHDALDDDVLADDDLADARPDVADELVGGLHGRGVGMVAHVLRGRDRGGGRNISGAGGAIFRRGT